MRTETRRMMIASKGLPSEYERLEYISNPNKGYIDTGFIPNQDTRITCKIKTPKGALPNNVFCFSSSINWLNRVFEFWVQGNHSCAQMSYDGQYNYGSKMASDTLYFLDLNKNVWNTEADTHTFNYVPFTCPHTLEIWRVKRDNEDIPTSVDYWDFKIYDNDSLVRDFIPVKRKSDGTIGMYDLVGRKFYTSPNGAEFTGGLKQEASNIN